MASKRIQLSQIIAYITDKRTTQLGIIMLLKDSGIRQHNIHTSQAVYRQFIDQSLRVMGERAAFSRLIGNLMIAKPHQLIWMDETTYSSVQMKAKSWSRKQDPVLHAKNNRQMRVTVFGAIGTCLQNGRVMRLAKSTNKQDFMSFLVDIKTSILPKYRSQMQILLFDGARAHTCHDSQAFM